MPVEAPTKPVQDSIGKVNDEIAVGSDLEFQRKWWRIENAVWVFLATILILDVAGLFGRGYLAKAHALTHDASLDIHYDRIARHGTPSRMTVRFGPNAVRNGKVQLWVSESVVSDLGNTRIVPEPLSAVAGGGGITYTFPVTSLPAAAVLSLEPAAIGPQAVAFRASGAEELPLHVFVMP